MIGAISLAIKGGLSVEQIAGTIQAHPTFTESIREAAFNMLRRSR
jgi:pyruvate/2-oxoglutarate dehydrogenase complex dihydrolipoamide dehydrogenase (E3) component